MKDLNVVGNGEKTDVWLTPPPIIASLGFFDLDPCSPMKRPWNTAGKHYTQEDDGLLLPWFGRVWLNSPYSELVKWLEKMALHGDGIALMFARTETKAFQQYVFPHASSLFFFKGRLKFYDEQGKVAGASAGAPSVLVAYKDYNSEAIEESGLEGYHVMVNAPDVFIIGSEDGRSWRVIVREAMEVLDGRASLEEIYGAVVRLAPKRIGKNRHYKEKVRQILQKYFSREEKGVYKVN